MYRNKVYRVRPVGEVLDEVREASAAWPDCPRVFLGDGDALAAPTDVLMEVLGALRAAFPRLRRVSLYSTPANLLEKSPQDLASLAGAGISLFYLGMESGSDEVLRRVGKGVTADEMAQSVLRGHAAGMKSSVMVLLGLGGEEGSEEHALSSARLANRMTPHYLSALTWMPVRQAPLFRQVESGRFRVPDDGGILRELRILIEALELENTIFHANHASNPLPVGGRLSRDKLRLLASVRDAEAGLIPMRPVFMRGT
jgi:radical SAM superfamily enzyme YgiQ (UPF0313 family)